MACELSEPILRLRYVLMNSRELCPEQACKLSGACELAGVKLSGLYCIRSCLQVAGASLLPEVGLTHFTLENQKIKFL